MSTIATLLDRARRFRRRSSEERRRSIRRVVKRVANSWASVVPLPTRLAHGGWWLAENDEAGDAIFEGTFERTERNFVARYLTRGMTVLDIGAHHGLYTLLASTRVGDTGRVIAFEPSPRELGKLHRHLRLNRRHNVRVEAIALGPADATQQLYVVSGRQTGLNSLRPPDAGNTTTEVAVTTTTLDGYLAQNQLTNIDFIKLDVEGAELGVLQGAEATLTELARPVILAELHDVRTAPWGYSAGAIYDHLLERRYGWYEITPDGELTTCHRPDTFELNLVAVPDEAIASVTRRIGVAT